MSAAKESLTISTIMFDIKAKVVPEKMRKLRAMVNMMEVLIFLFP